MTLLFPLAFFFNLFDKSMILELIAALPLLLKCIFLQAVAIRTVDQ